MRGKMSRAGFLIPALVLLGLFFGGEAYRAWTGPVAQTATAPPVAGAAAFGPSRSEAAPPADLSGLVTAIMARPLFRADRRPFQENAAVLAKRNYDAELSRFTLLGVLLLENEKKGVVVGKGGAGKEERWEVAPGDALPGFTVKEIGFNGMTLTADGREFLLPLYAGGPKGPAGQAPARTEVTAPRLPTAAAPSSPPGSGGAMRPATTSAPPRANVLSPPAAAPSSFPRAGGAVYPATTAAPPPANVSPLPAGTPPREEDAGYISGLRSWRYFRKK